MSILYSIKEDSAGLWCVWRGNTYLADRMTLERAIKEAGRLARDHHARTRLAVSVELDIAGAPSLLSHYAKPAPCAKLPGEHYPPRNTASFTGQ